MGVSGYPNRQQKPKPKNLKAKVPAYSLHVQKPMTPELSEKAAVLAKSDKDAAALVDSSKAEEKAYSIDNDSNDMSASKEEMRQISLTQRMKRSEMTYVDEHGITRIMPEALSSDAYAQYLKDFDELTPMDTW